MSAINVSTGKVGDKLVRDFGLIGFHTCPLWLDLLSLVTLSFIISLTGFINLSSYRPAKDRTKILSKGEVGVNPTRTRHGHCCDFIRIPLYWYARSTGSQYGKVMRSSRLVSNRTASARIPALVKIGTDASGMAYWSKSRPVCG